MPEATAAKIQCPACGHAQQEEMPTDVCLFFYKCPACQTVIRPKPGDCCVFCSYSDRLCPPREAGECCGPTMDPGEGSGRILLVDDQKAIVDGLTMFFERAGKHVVACSTFEAARQALLTSSFDTLLTDVRLGAYNGLQLAVIARQQNPTMRIVVFSGVDDPVLRNEATRLSATYLLKPVRGKELLDLMESAGS